MFHDFYSTTLTPTAAVRERRNVDINGNEITVSGTQVFAIANTAAATGVPYKADLLGKIGGISGAAITKGQKLMSDAQARLIPTTTATEAAASGVIANQTVTTADKKIEVWKLGA